MYLPNTPGVDFIGKLYRIDADTSKRYSLTVGDRVMSLIKWGGNARFVSVDRLSSIASGTARQATLPNGFNEREIHSDNRIGGLEFGTRDCQSCNRRRRFSSLCIGETETLSRADDHGSVSIER